jgi:hypothetical protein
VRETGKERKKESSVKLDASDVGTNPTLATNFSVDLLRT